MVVGTPEFRPQYERSGASEQKTARHLRIEKHNSLGWNRIFILIDIARVEQTMDKYFRCKKENKAQDELLFLSANKDRVRLRKEE